MMKLLYRIANGRNLILLFFLFLLSYLFLNAFHHSASILSIKEMSGGHTILNLLPYYDAELAYEHLLAYTPKAVVYYYRVLMLDLILVIPIYTAFFSVGISYFLEKLSRLKPKNVQLIAALPIVAGIINLIEDAVVTVLLYKLPIQFTKLASLSGYLTMLKTMIITACLLSILIMFVVFVFKSTIKKASASSNLNRSN